MKLRGLGALEPIFSEDNSEPYDESSNEFRDIEVGSELLLDLDDIFIGPVGPKQVSTAKAEVRASIVRQSF
jgi:hypothetical protein